MSSPSIDGLTDAIVAGTVTISGHGGDQIEAYLARPVDTASRGGVVVIHHMPGYDASTKEIVRRFYREAISERDAGACGLLTPDFVHNGEPRGRDGQRQAVEYFLTAFPDLEHEILRPKLSVGNTKPISGTK